MHKRGFYIRCGGTTHHEAALSRLVQPHATVRLVHVGNHLRRIEKRYEMLGEKSERVEDEILLGEPYGPTLRDTELCTDDPNVHICEFMWICDVADVPRPGEFRHSRTDDLCIGVQRSSVLLCWNSPGRGTSR